MSDASTELFMHDHDRNRSLWKDFSGSFRNAEFWALASWLDIIVRYRQSRFGIFWLVAPSIVFVWGMGSFFAAISNRPVHEFAAYVGIGYLLYRLLTAVIVDSTSAFAASGPFILDGKVRLTDFILRVMAKSMLYFVVSLPAVGVALFIHPQAQWIGVLLAVPYMLLVMANVLWIGVVFGLVGARFPDVNQFVGNVFMLAFLFTPIIWHVDSIPPGTVRYAIMLANPLFHMIELVRAPILGYELPATTLTYLGTMTVVGWLIAAAAYRRYANYVPIWI